MMSISLDWWNFPSASGYGWVELAVNETGGSTSESCGSENAVTLTLSLEN